MKMQNQSGNALIFYQLIFQLSSLFLFEISSAEIEYQYSSNKNSIEVQPSDQQQNIQIQAPSIESFFKKFKVYNVMPSSQKIIIVEQSASIYTTYKIMIKNSISSIVVWSAQKEMFVAVLTASDIMKLCVFIYKTYLNNEENIQKAKQYLLNAGHKFEKEDQKPEIEDFLQHITIKSIKQSQKLLISKIQTSLYDAISLMLDKRIHRLPIIDNDGSIVLSLTYRQACRFLVSKFHFNNEVLEQKIMDSGIPVQNCQIVHPYTTVLDTLRCIVQNNLSSVPVLDDNNCVLNVFSKYDFQAVGYQNDKIHFDLLQTVQQVLAKRPPYVEQLTTMPKDVTVGEVIKELADKSLHRIILIESETNRKFVAVVSLRMMLSYLMRPEIYKNTAISDYQSTQINLQDLNTSDGTVSKNM